MSNSIEKVHHPLFARFYTLLSRNESAEAKAHRRELLAGLSGRVLELGAGNGANFVHYPESVCEVVAVEPEAYLREQARTEAAKAPIRVTVVDGTDARLPAGDGSFDAAVACLVLCSVPDQAKALAELRRVVRSGGELRFYEHVLSRRSGIALSQRVVDRTFWPRAFGGCHTARHPRRHRGRRLCHRRAAPRVGGSAAVRGARRHPRPRSGTPPLGTLRRRVSRIPLSGQSISP